jgi:hypothetical protein
LGLGRAPRHGGAEGTETDGPTKGSVERRIKAKKVRGKVEE